MTDALLSRLRCPFCGTSLAVVDNGALRRAAGRVETGVLGCECCAFPVVAGIPVLIADPRTREAMHVLEAGRANEALEILLDLDAPRRQAFRALRARGDAGTYRDAVAVLSPDAEGTYFLYRFSDPTYRLAEGLVRALAGRRPDEWALDVCGGSGHLTRVLCARGAAAPTVVADLAFWKLWLARTFTAPDAEAVCCDANHPLPFSRDTFGTVVLSDAFPYIWHKRLLAEELMRLVAPQGALLLPHLHSALGENVSAGMPLTPAAYLGLFAPLQPRLYRDEDLLAPLLDGAALELGRDVAADATGATPAVTLVASLDPGVFTTYAVPSPGTVTGSLVVNPLYALTRRPGSTVLALTFPTPEYAAEFGGCRRYLPDVVEVAADLTGPLDEAGLRATLGATYDDLRRRRVLMDAPPRYC